MNEQKSYCCTANERKLVHRLIRMRETCLTSTPVNVAVVDVEMKEETRFKY